MRNSRNSETALYFLFWSEMVPVTRPCPIPAGLNHVGPLNSVHLAFEAGKVARLAIVAVHRGYCEWEQSIVSSMAVLDAR